MRNIVVVCYAHPELYPPTLNAISELSKIYNNVYVYGLNTTVSKWIYPKNVHVTLFGNGISTEKMMRWNPLKKWWFYLKWTKTLKQIVLKNQIKNIVFYDTFPFFAIWLNRFLTNKNYYIWYHNHDVLDRNFVKPLSPSWASAIIEDKFMNKLNLFTLPAMERLPYFSFNKEKVKTVHLPNFPAKQFYREFRIKKHIDNEVKIIYQGAVDNQHGLEEIIQCLSEKIEGKRIHLGIAGNISNKYKEKLRHLAKQLNVHNQLTIYGQIPYLELPKITANYHIGIAIYKPISENIQFETVASASNKIYEYAALGLPVLLYNSNYFKTKLNNYKWCFFTNLDKDNILATINNLIKNYTNTSEQAVVDFERDLNYEKVFEPVKEILINESF